MLRVAVPTVVVQRVLLQKANSRKTLVSAVKTKERETYAFTAG